ncbi:metal ABC transporter solute-binding protein, Zn/Mn family [Maridesulfovibrio ferrireducens]|uniref:metal ABC transporter solute-binding protein, Zn/Mn family n=1 Tax=Maridesulfovibrio ferrireducens TaxID=246191 RepID=UPI001A2A3E26|nr:zinc ABC transporter substrate-binding protein [Maridesulfovibrio ferrireducens]MBI9111768.1 zinc ABC transporter substrate-binding protein [Maridesulfovibrio ferrireducens]
MPACKLKYIFTIALLLIGTVAHTAPLQVTVSIVPQKYFVKKIGGDLVDVNVMVRPGRSPAIYEPQPRQMAQLSKAAIYFAIGVPFEQAWLPRFKSANTDLKIVHLSECVVKQPMQEHLHEEKEHRDHNENFLTDPHIWLSPPLVRILTIQIRDSLIEADPKNANIYRKNYYTFAGEIDELDNELINTFKDSTNQQSFMVYHPSWGYFARAYGLRQIPIELEGKEPSPKEMTHIIDFARKNSVSTIFIQPQFSRKSAQAIASSIGARILDADPLSADWDENLRKTAKAFLNGSH